MPHGQACLGVVDVLVADADDPCTAFVSDFEGVFAVSPGEDFFFAETDEVIHGLADVNHAFDGTDAEEGSEVGDVFDLAEDGFFALWDECEEGEAALVVRRSISGYDASAPDVGDSGHVDNGSEFFADVSFVVFFDLAEDAFFEVVAELVRGDTDVV